MMIAGQRAPSGQHSIAMPQVVYNRQVCGTATAHLALAGLSRGHQRTVVSDESVPRTCTSPPVHWWTGMHTVTPRKVQCTTSVEYVSF